MGTAAHRFVERLSALAWPIHDAAETVKLWRAALAAGHGSIGGSHHPAREMVALSPPSADYALRDLFGRSDEITADCPWKHSKTLYDQREREMARYEGGVGFEIAYRTILGRS
jgi:hypothetical protein